MSQLSLRRTVQIGLIAGMVALSISAIGMVVAFDERDIITGVLTLGQLVLFGIPLIVGYVIVRGEVQVRAGPALLHGFVAGFFVSLPLIGLILLTLIWPNIRQALPNVSPTLVDILTFGQDPIPGSVILALVMMVIGALGAAFHLLPERVQKPLFSGVAWTLGIGLFSEVLINIFRPFPRQFTRIIFGTTGITPLLAMLIFIIATVFSVWWEAGGRKRYRDRREALTKEQEARINRSSRIALVILILALPWILGIYLTEVLDVVGIFILMGLGLNIVVGFAGLLDLGYVAFFAIGAYVMGLLTSTGELGVAGLPFWVALPFSILAATIAGVMLGIPVLRMRGDYLAIVTLGFGEIIRLLAASDFLKPIIGGAQGILNIGRPTVPILDFLFIQPQHFYYLILLGCLLAIWVSSRLRDRRPGRRWMALREDEDVAEAVGIHLVNTKLLAFAIGAAFGGLAGGIFASRLASIFPHSFNLLISINVLSLIIVGGIGSIPGVVVGALFLVGLPELLREFAEYRLLMYGAAIILMMLLRPEGLWPSPVTKRELHAEEEIAEREGIQHEQVAELI
ncbi:MAG: leucine/isoleucine/valine transporter permease subunit [Chloroflexota bacterium]|jgi:branched-chain amino acid transport system permease protein